jgi:hypothetical protein
MNNFLLGKVFRKNFLRIGDTVRTIFLKTLWNMWLFQFCKSRICSKSCSTDEIFYIQTFEWILYKLTKFQTMLGGDSPSRLNEWKRLILAIFHIFDSVAHCFIYLSKRHSIEIEKLPMRPKFHVVAGLPSYRTSFQYREKGQFWSYFTFVILLHIFFFIFESAIR